jgi:hypothetical protein
MTETTGLPNYDPARAEALAKEYASIYEADDIAFQLGMITTEQRTGQLSRIFEVSTQYGEFAPGSLEFFNGITRAKVARSQMKDPDEYDRYARMALAGSLDDSPFTPRFLGDVIASRLESSTPSSQSILNAIEQVKADLQDLSEVTRISTPLVIGRILTGQMQMLPSTAGK